MNRCIHRRKAPLLLLLLTFLLLGFVIDAKTQGNFSLVNLRCNNAVNPLGIDATTPQFSWEFTTGNRNFKQVAYQVLVADSPDQLDIAQGNVWNSGKVISGQSSGILFKG